MTRAQPTSGEFARLGFNSPETAAKLWQRWAERLGQEPTLELAALSRYAADPDQALEALARVHEQAPDIFGGLTTDPAWRDRAIRVLGASTVLARFFTRHPAELAGLRPAPAPRGAQGWAAFFQERMTAAEPSPDEVRRANYAALSQVAAFDLAAAEPTEVVETVGQELSHIADAVLASALNCARAEVANSDDVRLAVVALGKTGAQELNYLSDVDVVYLAEPAEGVQLDDAMRIGAQVAGALARICSAHTPEGSIWEVDAALRPEGKSGSLVRTLAASRKYYETWAKNWEFQAMLKARPVAGDLELGQAFCDLIQPMVWQAGQRPGFLPEIRAMRQRVISLIAPARVEREIKLGPGGLRDTEFSVQLLQLVHGRADDRIRARGTFEGLDQLVACGYIGRDDGMQLRQAYQLQRVLEHRVQLRHLRRTHLLPLDDEAAMRHLARSLGSTPEALVERWRASTRLVQRLQQRLFYSPLLDTVSSIPTEGLLLSPAAARTRMAALGFDDPQSALGHIEALTKGTNRTAAIQRQLLPAMLDWFADGPNPDFGLLAFRRLSESLGRSSWYLRALRDEGYMAQRLARVASSSRYAVDLLRRAPEMVQMLSARSRLEPRSQDELRDAMVKAARRADDSDKAVASVRAMRRAELCRIALSDVLGDSDLDETMRALTALSAASIDAALAVAARDIEAPPVGVVAMGRWGGEEMNYSSDADVMYVVPDEVSREQLVAAQRLVGRAADVLGQPGPDPALHLDCDLRPEGRGGPQLRTVESYAAYYRNWSSTWESQALLRARPGAGELALAQQVVAAADRLRYPEPGLTDDQLLEIRRLKSRMETERIPKGVPRKRHLKLGPGGLADVEWTAQLLQLRHGAAHPELQTTSTLGALAAARGLGMVSDRQENELRQAWRRASGLRNAIMLVRGRASDSLPIHSRELATVGELVGYRTGQSSQLIDDTQRDMRLARRCFESLFWDS